MTKKELEKIVKIAQANIVTMENRADLERHYNDEEDFLDIAVWELKTVLEAAYELGRKADERDTSNALVRIIVNKQAIRKLQKDGEYRFPGLNKDESKKAAKALVKAAMNADRENGIDSAFGIAKDAFGYYYAKQINV